jgi:hypothetical protein
METEYRRRYVEIVGLGLTGGGLAFMVAGWLGLRDQRSVVEQLPYLASGGIIGLALVIAGAAVVYLTRQFRLERAVADLANHQKELEAALDRFVVAMGETVDLRVPLAAAQNHRAARRGPVGSGHVPKLSVPDPEG